MKKNFRIFAGLALALALTASCSKITSFPEIPTDEISFSGSINGLVTKATDTAFETGDEISVTAYSASGEEFASNVNYSFNGTTFTSDNAISYEEGTETLSFRAVYPYTELNGTSVDFAVKSDQSITGNYTLSDLMSSYVAPTSLSTPTLAFGHLLTKIALEVTSENVDMNGVVAYVNAIGGITYDISTLESTLNGVASNIAMASDGVNAYKAIIAPQTITTENTFIILEISGVSYTLALENTVSFIGGCQYTISMTVSASSSGGIDITFEAPSIADWTDSGLYDEPVDPADPDDDTDLRNYTLFWQDEFEGSSLSTSNWNIEVNSDGGGNSELQYYSSNNVAVGAEPETGVGSLIITARKENAGGRSATSGRVNTLDKVYFQYGRVDARVKLPKTANGLWPAFWLMGNDYSSAGWPACGEIDVLEMGSSDGISAGTQESYLISAMHWGSSYSVHQYTSASYLAPYSLQDDFHLWSLIWDEDSVNIYLDLDKYPDNAPYYTRSIRDSSNSESIVNYFKKPFFIIVNLAVGGSLTGLYSISQITALDSGDANMYVDYIRVYERN